MILIGQYDSPFVRRVGIAMTLYGMQFEHRPWASFGDADRIRPYNPLTRVPTLVLDDGDVLIESHVIIDYLDSLVPEETAMYPRKEPERRRALKISALATGLADKSVSLFYEQRLHAEASGFWAQRCRAQIEGVLAWLEENRADRSSAFWFGERIGHADIAVSAALRHLNDAHPDMISIDGYPALKAHWAHCESLPVFKTISQPFIAPT